MRTITARYKVPENLIPLHDTIQNLRKKRYNQKFHPNTVIDQSGTLIPLHQIIQYLDKEMQQSNNSIQTQSPNVASIRNPNSTSMDYPEAKKANATIK